MKGLLFTYLMTYGGAVVSLFWPFAGLLIYIGFAILCPEGLWHWSVPKGNYSRIVAIAFLIGWGLQGFGRWRFGSARGILGALLAFLAVWIMTGFSAPDQQLAWGGFEWFLKIVLPFVAGLTLIESTKQLKQLVWVIVVSQGYLAYEFNQTYFSGGFNADEFRFRGLDNNGIAITMVTTIGLAFFLALGSRKWWQKLIGFGSAALMAHVVLFSMSRGGMLALVVTGAVCFLLLPKSPQFYLVFALGALLVLRLAGPNVRNEFATSFESSERRDASSALRTKHWKACIESMIHRPFGVGPDHWPLTAPEYGLPAMEAHSTWLQLGAEFGIPGLVSILTFYGVCIVRLWPIAREKISVVDPWLVDLARMVIAGLSGFLVSAQFVSVEGVELSYFVTLLGAGGLKVNWLAQRDLSSGTLGPGHAW